VARRLAAQYGVNLHQITATGRHGRVSKADLETAILAAGGKLSGPPAATAGGRKRATGDDSAVAATPVARRLARELDINLLDCRASGTRGRVCKADVEARAAQPAKASVVRPVRDEQTVPESAAAFEELPLSGMRKTIAARLQQSKQTAPHFRVQVDVEMDALLALRRGINDSNTRAKVSVNDFIIKACACTLLKVPAVNVQFDGETVRRFSDADIAVAVALDEGLITPIVRQANRKGLIAISGEVRELATRAKLGKLQAQEFQGGTFTVSNLGMFGIKQFDAIINPPQGAILAVGAGEPRPVLRDGEWQTGTVMSLSLSSDHRIIDGAVAARFMSALKRYLEQPGTMLG
jgi:pyruvate dehydrogenase E2 component (dihydrolipoamide acetyltransferase)